MDSYTLKILARQFVQHLIDDSINETIPLQDFLSEHSDYDNLPFEDQMSCLSKFEDALRKVISVIL